MSSDTDYTDYKVTNAPYKQDIIKKWVEAFKAEGHFKIPQILFLINFDIAGTIFIPQSLFRSSGFCIFA